MSAPRGRARLRILAEAVPSVTTFAGAGHAKGERCVTVMPCWAWTRGALASARARTGSEPLALRSPGALVRSWLRCPTKVGRRRRRLPQILPESAREDHRPRGHLVRDNRRSHLLPAALVRLQRGPDRHQGHDRRRCRGLLPRVAIFATAQSTSALLAAPPPPIGKTASSPALSLPSSFRPTAEGRLDES